MDDYNVFHNLPQIMYLYTCNNVSSHYHHQPTEELKKEHKQHYHDSLVGPHSRFGECQYSNVFPAIMSMFKVNAFDENNVRPENMRPEADNVVVISTSINCQNGGNHEEMMVYGVSHFAVILIFPCHKCSEVWDSCIIYHPQQAEESAVRVLGDVIGHHGCLEGMYMKHGLKGIDIIGTESCFLMILYAIVGYHTNTLSNFRCAIASLQLEDNLVPKVRHWISTMLENKRFEQPAWMSQIPNINFPACDMSSVRRKRKISADVIKEHNKSLTGKRPNNQMVNSDRG